MVQKILYGAALVGLILLAGYWLLSFENKDESPVVTPEAAVVQGQATYLCTDGHTVQAVFMEQGPVPVSVPGQPPTSNAFVLLRLDTAPEIRLPQVVSADGGRYANDDESLVFWIKGSGAMVLENDEQTTYKNCIAVQDDTGNLPQVYLDEAQRFTLRYPVGYTTDTSYVYQNLSLDKGPDNGVRGVAFTIPSEMASGTNLSRGSYLSIEHLNNSQNCMASDFLPESADVENVVVTDGDFTYSVASLNDAGVGNRYEETVYAIPGTSPCLAVRYYIHYSAIENYDPGAVTEFDKVALLAEFDAIRQSMTLDRQLVPSPLVTADVYPLYADLSWQGERVDTYADMEGYSVTSAPLTDITDINAVTQPFEDYYADLLTNKGWVEDITLAAGGPGAAVTAYKKGREYIVLQYQSEFGVQNASAPAECPCEVTFSIFSGSSE